MDISSISTFICLITHLLLHLFISLPDTFLASIFSSGTAVQRILVSSQLYTVSGKRCEILQQGFLQRNPCRIAFAHLWHSENTMSDTTENDYCSTIKPLLNKHTVTKGEILETNSKFADPPFFKIWRGASLFPPGQEP